MQILTFEEQYEIYQLLSIEPFTRVLSPLRVESRPSFSTYESGGKILWKDFSTGDGGDIINLIMILEGMDYKEAIKFATELLDGRLFNAPVGKKKNLDNRKVFTESIQKDFELSFWERRGINLDQLKKENVFSLKSLFVGDKYKTSSTEENPKFVYMYSTDSWKIYSPLDQHYKWLSHNIKDPFEIGITGFRDLVLLPSKKDRMVFENVGMPVSTISLHSETNFNPLLKELNTSLLDYDRIFCLLDFDQAGLDAMDKIHQKSEGRIQPIKIKKNVLNFLLESNVKDVDEVYLKFGKEKLKSFLIKIFKENLYERVVN